MLSKVDINLLIKLTRFNFVSHRGSIESMTKKHRKHHKRSLRWNLGERRSLQIFMNHFFSSLDNYLGADRFGRPYRYTGSQMPLDTSLPVLLSVT